MRVGNREVEIPVEAFHQRVVTTEDSCWFWKGAYGIGGYGQISVRHNGEVVCLKAHRIAWELANDSIPTGMEVDHRCRNRSCVRPDHLRLLTPAENKSNASRLNRRPVPPTSWASELRKVRDQFGLTQIDLGHALGVSEATVANWECGRRTPNVTVRSTLHAKVDQHLRAVSA